MIALLHGDARSIPLPNESVHCAITSPPYWGLRDYGLPPLMWGGSPGCAHEWGKLIEQKKRGKVGDHSTLEGGSQRPESHDDAQVVRQGAFCAHCGAWRGSLGLEPTPDLYSEHLVQVMREVWRVLRPDGTLWLNLGDSYTSGGRTIRDPRQSKKHLAFEGDHFADGLLRPDTPDGLKPKDLCMIPARVAIALQADGWYLRSDIIWSKPNPMPESVTDRTTKSHEYIFLLSKSERYYYDQLAIAEPFADSTPGQLSQSDLDNQMGGFKTEAYQQNHPGRKMRDRRPADILRAMRDNGRMGRNRRSVWTVATTPYPGAHFATFPPALVEPMILAGTSAQGCCPACGAPWVRITEKHFQPQEDVSLQRGVRGADGQKPMDQNNHWQGIPRGTTESVMIDWHPSCTCNAGDPIPCTVLDPFAGTSTVGRVCARHGRRFVGIELNPSYIALARERTRNVQMEMRA